MEEKILLSVLIPSMPERQRKFLPRVLKTLHAQAADRPVEILVFTDNRKRTIGEKRNQLVELAKGEYFCFVDDDDKLARDYIDQILNALETRPDCVVFNAWVTINGRRGNYCRYGKEFRNEDMPEGYYRQPNHLMVHRRERVKDLKFLHVNYGEDDEWGARVVPRIRTQVRIDKVLYYYRYSDRTSRSSR